MKINQTDSTLEIKTSATAQVIGGAICVILGIGLIVYSLISLSQASHGQKPSVAYILFGLAFLLIGALLLWFASSRRIVLQKKRMVQVRLLQKEYLEAKPRTNHLRLPT